MEQPIAQPHTDDTAGQGGSPASHSSQFDLLRQRRFAPFFWTQFAGAANDNLFKFAFTVMVTYQLQVDWLPPALAGLVIGALFILPFLLFSATSGQITDKLEKARIMRFVKNLEVAIMAAGAWGLLAHDVPVLLACIFLMGLHSTIFGPVKYAYLPQALDERELTGGNGMVEMGTFVAILLGNVAGGVLIAVPEVGHAQVAIACVALALAGRAAAQFIPAAPATDPGLKINWNPVSETWRNLMMARTDPVVFRSLLGISWMWFFGAVFLSQFPSFAKEVLHGDEQVASLLLVVFSVGVGAGSLLCEVLGRRRVEIGLVPLGAIGMSVFGIDLYFASRGLPPSSMLTAGEFLARPQHWRVLADLGLLSLFAGLYSVPMYALIQLRAQASHRARIIAANNILNALFMIASALIAGMLLGKGYSIPQVFLFVAVANAAAASYVFATVPEYPLRFVAWMLSRFAYRLRASGEQHIPQTGPALLMCNHAGFADALLMMAASPRPIVFVTDHRVFRMPLPGLLFRLARAIPDAPRAAGAVERAAQVLSAGELLAVFSETSAMKILDRARQDGVEPPAVPMALARGSFFSRAFLNIGEPVPGAQVRPGLLRERVQELLAQR